jgi:tetratricopeptide (TPR) repeat protein
MRVLFPSLPSPAAITATLLGVLTALGASSAEAADSEKLRLRNELGIVQAKSGHLEDALRQFTLVLAEAPNEPAALNNTANIYFLNGETERACDLYQRASGSAPQEGGVHLNLGLALHASGDPERALAHVREGLRLVGDLQHAYFLLGLSSGPADEATAGGDASGAATGGDAPDARPAHAATAASQPRASDEAGLRGAEVEALLARALAKVPHADSTATRVVADGAMTSRPAGSKAAQLETSPQRLFWMPMPARP